MSCPSGSIQSTADCFELMKYVVKVPHFYHWKCYSGRKKLKLSRKRRVEKGARFSVQLEEFWSPVSVSHTGLFAQFSVSSCQLQIGSLPCLCLHSIVRLPLLYCRQIWPH